MMQKVSQIGMVVIFLLTIVFHLLVLVKIIPYGIVWGGRLQSDSQMYKFEATSIAINLLFMMIILVKSGYLKIRISPLIIRIFLWLMTGLFLLNTIDNLLSDNHLERIIFTPVTIILSIFGFVLAVSKSQKQ